MDLENIAVRRFVGSHADPTYDPSAHTIFRLAQFLGDTDIGKYILTREELANKYEQA